MDASSAESILAYVEATAPGITGPDARVALDGLLERHADVLAAMTWFIEADRPDDALRIANAMYRFWITQQRFDEGALWFGRVLARTAATSTCARRPRSTPASCRSGRAMTHERRSCSVGRSTPGGGSATRR